MEKVNLTFNDLPEVVAQLRDEVMSLKSLLTEQNSTNNAKAVDTHVPMSVDEAAEYLGIPKGTLYMKLSDGSIPATKPGKRYCLYRDELDKWLESSRKNPVPLSDEELNYLDDGIDVHIKLEVKDITDTVSAADKQAVESVANGYPHRTIANPTNVTGKSHGRG